ncbi:radical SAM family heme chaperone HemW [Synechococcus sp. MIT S1220]|uniref:radical SAM family heme chaperone HemW n=1 Tax=Synechococcus sp. MIT S1220 TaxID=3082549 RepID=UPI0039B01C40
MPYPSPPRSAYLHIPFCHRRCYYCDFAVVPLGDRARADAGPGSASIRDYLGLLHREISSAAAGPPLSTIYIGGGTPSLLSASQIAALLEALRSRFGIQQGAEVTMEMDPASFDQGKLLAVLEAGVNRISLGGQSFDDAVLAQLGRRHQGRDLIEACAWLDELWRSGDLCSWSLDLIQNLPDQSLDDWQDQLARAMASRAPHLSIYDLSIEPGTVFAKLQRQGMLQLPEDDLAVQLMAHTSRQLAEGGYRRYEISNHAKPGHASRHNRVYWSGAAWWGFGMGATGAPWGERLARPRTREGYRSWLDSQAPEDNKSSPRPLPLDDLLLVGLRRREGVDLQALECPDQEGLLKRWQPFRRRGLLNLEAGRWCLSDPQGMALSNQVLVEVLLWWEELISAGSPMSSEHRKTSDGLLPAQD